MGFGCDLCLCVPPPSVTQISSLENQLEASVQFLRGSLYRFGEGQGDVEEGICSQTISASKPVGGMDLVPCGPDIILDPGAVVPVLVLVERVAEVEWCATRACRLLLVAS